MAQFAIENGPAVSDHRENSNLCAPRAVGRKGAASILGVSTASLDRLVRRGLIHPIRALRIPMFALVELDRYLTDETSAR